MLGSSSSGTLLLDRRDVTLLVRIDEAIAALEAAFEAQARQATGGSVSTSLPVPGGGFHAKGAGLKTGAAHYVAFKLNGNFPQNPTDHGLPTIQGLILLADATRGTPLAVMDSIEVTALRTAAATAVAARRLAPPGTRRATIAGCGVQGWAHARALRSVLPGVEFSLHDLLAERMDGLATRIRDELGGLAAPAPDLAAAVRASDIVVTCTTAREPFLRRDWLSAGAFVAAVGADAAGKQELESEVLADSRVVVDDLEACAGGGELRHALAAGVVRREDVAANLADVVAGRGVRLDPHDVVVFDSTGIALEDVAVAALVYERAVKRGIGQRLEFGGEPAANSV
jgi:alanine dehydrogenase